jgi:transcriptional repressor NrdR
MYCPFCANNESQVLESRVVDEGRAVRRRRECLKCKKRFTTYEAVRGNALWVIKKDGRREPYDSEKVKRGILRAIEKRPVSMDLVNEIVRQVEREMLKKEREEVSSREVGKAVYRRLKKIDKVAWLRFTSVYLEFNTLEDFARAIKE